MKYTIVSFIPSTLIALSMVIALNVGAYDLPQFYRAPHFYGHSLSVHDKWESLVSARASKGSTSCAYDAHGSKIPVFNLYGCSDISRLGFNVETGGECPKPLTEQFLAKGGTIPSLNFERNNGKLSFDGSFEMWEVDIEWWQNMMYGLFAYAYLPIRHLETKDICCRDCTTPDNSNAQTFSDFLANDFSNILSENCLCPCATPFEKTGLGDPALMLGWHGNADMPPGLITDISGMIGAHVTFPVSSERSSKNIFSIPTGYEGHWGLGLRIQSQVGIKRWFSLGMTGGALIFLNKKRCHRMITDCGQRGPIILDTGYADVDPGQLWDIGAYLKADRFLKGLSITLGYSYTKKEHTRLAVLDNCFLHTFCQEQCTYGSPLTNMSKNSIVNNACQLREWDVHTLHVMCDLDLEPLLNLRLSPVVSFIYNYPFTGKRVYTTDSIGGSFGLHIKWRR